MNALVALTVAVTLLWCAPVSAQRPAVGEVVDAAGEVIGELRGTADEPVVILTARGLTFALRVLPDSTFAGYAERTYASHDCTGTGYLTAGGLLDAVEVRRGYRVMGVRAGARARRITLGSYTERGECVAYIGGPEIDVYPATLIVDLTGRWVPPFRIR